MSADPEDPSFSPGHEALLAARREEIREELARWLSPGESFVWEVGSGHGHFLTAYATAHPALTCLGIDLASDRVARARRKRDRAGLRRLHFLRGDARLFLEALPAGASFSRIFILFPDPWPKLRHHKHRIIQPDFLTRVAAHAARECELHLRTDFEPYFQDACGKLQASACWEITDPPLPWPFEHATVFQSRAHQHYSVTARLRPGISAPNQPGARANSHFGRQIDQSRG
jgi:tRNA (guanine-N7-)-methyltransferase